MLPGCLPRRQALVYSSNSFSDSPTHPARQVAVINLPAPHNQAQARDITPSTAHPQEDHVLTQSLQKQLAKSVHMRLTCLPGRPMPAWSSDPVSASNLTSSPRVPRAVPLPQAGRNPATIRSAPAA